MKSRSIIKGTARTNQIEMTLIGSFGLCLHLGLWFWNWGVGIATSLIELGIICQETSTCLTKKFPQSTY